MQYSEFCRPSGPQSENQRKQKERQVLRPYQTTKNAVKHEGDGDTNCNWHTRNSPQRLGKVTGRDANNTMNQDHPDYNIVEID